METRKNNQKRYWFIWKILTFKLQARIVSMNVRRTVTHGWYALGIHTCNLKRLCSNVFKIWVKITMIVACQPISKDIKQHGIHTKLW